MLGEDRRRQIFELIREEGSARVSQLSRTFSVSEPTIRSDLEKLESQGLVIRDHGGAYLRGIDALVRSQTLHHGENAVLYDPRSIDTAAGRLRELIEDRKLAGTIGSNLRSSRQFTTWTGRGELIYRFICDRLEGRAARR